MRKTLILVLSFIFIMAAVTNSYAAFSDVPSGASYLNALERLSVLGIMGGTDNGTFKPDEMLTREQFAKVIVVASGLGDDAKTLKGSTVFADIPLNAWSSGYINEALNKGFIAGMPDGKFHPGEKVTFAQACTVLVRALGYTDADLKGYWPNNYIEKARTLKLTEGVTLDKNDGLPRCAAAVMIDALLSTNVKSTGTQESDKTFAEASGLYSSHIYMGDSNTMEKLSASQILTDKGIYYMDGSLRKGLEMGNQYEFYIENDKVTKVFNKLGSVLKLTVESALGNRVLYKDETGKESSMTLPDKTLYYYDGVKLSYDKLGDVLQSDTSIVFAYNKSKDAYDYAVIFNPVYSKPQTGYSLDVSKKKIGNIAIEDGIKVLRDGEQSGLTDIEDKDVVYKVTDIWGKNGFLIVSGKVIEGSFKAFLPSRTSPKQIKIDSTTYDLGKDMDLSIITSSSSGFKEDDYITALTGHDGKIVDILQSIDDGTNYGFVINYSTVGSDSGTIMYSVKLLLPNNLTSTYRVDFDPEKYKGKLVTYKMLDNERIYIEDIQHGDSVQCTVNRGERKIGPDYVADDVKIFNLISNKDGSDAEVSLLDWSDIPSGTYVSGFVSYFIKSGAFNDIGIIVTNDILNQKNKLGVIKSTNLGSSKILVNGKEYTYGSLGGLSIDTVLEFSMNGTGVEALVDADVSSADTATTISAIDSKRIKLGNNIYWFRDDVSIYYRDFKGEVAPVSVRDLDIKKVFSKVSVYTDDKGMVRLIMISER